MKYYMLALNFKMSFGIIILIICSLSSCNTNDTRIYGADEVMRPCSYSHGNTNFGLEVSENLKKQFAKNQISPDSLNTRVYANIIVGKKGSISDVSLMEADHIPFSQIIVQAIKETDGEWNPALDSAGKPVNFRIVLPLKFGTGISSKVFCKKLENHLADSIKKANNLLIIPIEGCYGCVNKAISFVKESVDREYPINAVLVHTEGEKNIKSFNRNFDFDLKEYFQIDSTGYHTQFLSDPRLPQIFSRDRKNKVICSSMSASNIDSLFKVIEARLLLQYHESKL